MTLRSAGTRKAEDGVDAGNDIGRHLLIEPFLPISHCKRDVFYT